MTFRTIGLNIDDAVYQQALSKAASQGKTINVVVAELVAEYAGPVQPVVSTPVVSTPAPTPAPTPSSSSASTTYTVQSGDTLGTISRRFYGSANKYYLIQNANNLTNPSQIYVGQRLIIPGAGDTSVTPGAPATTPSVVTSRPSTPSVSTSTITAPPVVKPAGTSGKNPRPTMEFYGSPNFNRRPRGEISAIVMHATANGTLQGVIDWFNRSDAQVSAHYTIGKDGTIAQHVRDEHRAWHAGSSEWQGRSDLNSWSIGIELVNWNNGQDPYPEAQHQAAVDLCAYLCTRYHINPDLIVAHYDVSPRRKTDPKGYDMDRLRREVAARI